jgi:hypothetical protein
MHRLPQRLPLPLQRLSFPSIQVVLYRHFLFIQQMLLRRVVQQQQPSLCLQRASPLHTQAGAFEAVPCCDE